jgi:hypothetical protein
MPKQTKQKKKLQEKERAVRRKLSDTGLVKVHLKDNKCFSYINTGLILNVGSIVKVAKT